MCRPPPPIWYAKIVGRGSEFAELRKGQFHHHLERGRGSRYSDKVNFSISCSRICLTQSSMIKSHPISWRSGYIIRVHGLERGQIWEISSHAPNSKGEQEMGIGPEGGRANNTGLSYLGIFEEEPCLFWINTYWPLGCQLFILCL